jgi:disulfide oxidoreductase YuzD
MREKGGGKIVVKIYCWDTKTIYIVHSPASTETATRLEQIIRENLREISEDIGIDIEDTMRLNLGNDEDRRILERIERDEDCFEVKF